MKHSLKKKILTYTAIFEPAEEGGYIVKVPALPGCVTQGETFEEAIEMIKDAVKGYIAVLEEEGLEVPQEQTDLIITHVSVQNPAVL